MSHQKREPLETSSGETRLSSEHKLLAKAHSFSHLFNTLFVAFRPDGFKAVCLAEDAGRYSFKNGVDPEAERSNRQIYLTFPATSVFGEQDVRDYFR